MSFEKFELDAKILAGVQACGYNVPTPIQLQSIPPIMEGRDVMGLAQTGTGKTAAFVLPILQRLMQGARGHVRALIIAPTRELSEQTHTAIMQLGRKTKLRSVSIYGGVNINGQINKLRNNVEIISACPGRLLDHINRGTVDLSRIEVLVLDEADHMFDMGFLPDIRKIVKHLPAQRQTLLFSATMPDDIRSLANDLLINPVNIKIGHTAPVETVSHKFYPVQMSSKTDLLKDILDKTDMDSVLIFTRTKSRAKSVALQLGKSGYKVTSLHGNLTQQKRQHALDGFRDGRYEIMVATDIAARGIDVNSISHVINYDMPSTTDAYTHRIGRTGRAAKTGDAFTFVTGEDRGLAQSLERVLGKKLHYQNVDGLTMSLPVDDRVSASRNSRGRNMKPHNDRKKFSPKARANSRLNRRSFDSSNRSQWAH
ncbi:MAG TPA: DEAD/DEAH box helicase [Smithella sp.]|jgi:ATP-dependent RNA helicase RhlE|nr:DEAD/DEAH box helicase [Smithella sp.]HNQ65770.1 DEAD/DEAH box helicase [Smithella sp.]HOE31744.1 DEAD/DEAH box helicase [Smithella sp.]HOG11048.1 DEAD/DEAH box helicase [Smithella sp.]HOS15098.1 DEAD/DEAH box helicase [Smithella sp.]